MDLKSEVYAYEDFNLEEFYDTDHMLGLFDEAIERRQQRELNEYYRLRDIIKTSEEQIKRRLGPK